MLGADATGTHARAPSEALQPRSLAAQALPGAARPRVKPPPAVGPRQPPPDQLGQACGNGEAPLGAAPASMATSAGRRLPSPPGSVACGGSSLSAAAGGQDALEAAILRRIAAVCTTGKQRV